MDLNAQGMKKCGLTKHLYKSSTYNFHNKAGMITKVVLLTLNNLCIRVTAHTYIKPIMTTCCCHKLKPSVGFIDAEKSTKQFVQQ